MSPSRLGLGLVLELLRTRFGEGTFPVKTERGSYDYVDANGERRRLTVGFLGAGGGLSVELKESHPQQPLPRSFEPDLPLEDQEHPRMVA